MNTAPRPQSASDLLAPALASPEPVATPEQPAPSARTYTVEDYIDTRQKILDTRRHLAKKYLTSFEGGDREDDEKRQALAEPFAKDNTPDKLKWGEDALMLMQKQSARRAALESRPAYEEHFPKDGSAEERERWGAFVSDQPKNTHSALKYVQEQSARLEEITRQPGIAEELENLGAEKRACLATASEYRHLERWQAKLADDIVTERLEAIRDDEPNAPYLIAKAKEMKAMISQLESQKIEILSEGDREANLNELERRSDLDKKRQLDDGLLLTTQMQEVLKIQMTSAILGKPILIVGETGGAKTALAREIARRIQRINDRPDQVNQEPLLFSGYGEANTYQLMGKDELGTRPDPDTEITDEQEKRYKAGKIDESSDEYAMLMRKLKWKQLTNGTETYFVPGALLKAMQEGLPIILDEINAMQPEILKRLNDILLLKPGDTFTVQEDSGLEFKVKAGFCVIATANEKSSRYKGVDDLSVELQSRFTANTARIPYPDMDVEVGERPPNLLSLALVAITDKHGNQILPKITAPDGSELPANEALERFTQFVIVCHYTQKLFTQPSNSAEFATVISTEQQTAEGKTALKENVLAPRTMVQLIQKAVDSGGEISLNATIDDYLKGIKDPGDKALITKVFANYGFGSEK